MNQASKAGAQVGMMLHMPEGEPFKMSNVIYWWQYWVDIYGGGSVVLDGRRARGAASTSMMRYALSMCAQQINARSHACTRAFAHGSYRLAACFTLTGFRKVALHSIVEYVFIFPTWFWYASETQFVKLEQLFFSNQISVQWMDFNQP